MEFGQELRHLSEGDRVAALVARLNGWKNAYTAFGTHRDRTAHTRFEADRHSYQELREAWEGGGIIARFIEQPAEAMYRGDVKVGTGRQDWNDYVRGVFDKAKLLPSLARAEQFSDAYGLGAVFLGFDDGRNLALPVAQGAKLIWTRAYDRQELFADQWDVDPYNPTFGHPTMWRVVLWYANGLQYVHPSRLLILPGRLVNNAEQRQRQGAGMSMLTGFLEKLGNLDGAERALLNIITDFSVAVIGIDNLRALVASKDPADAQSLENRARIWDMFRSSARAIPVDAEKETYQRITASVAGLPESIDRLMIIVAAYAGRPVSIMFGRQPSGLQATGESDIRSWYDELDGKRTQRHVPLLRRAARYVLDSISSGGCWQGNETIEFEPLWQPTEQERADVRKTDMETYTGYVNAGVLDPEEVAEAVFGGEESSIRLDVSARKAVRRAQRAPRPAPAAPPQHTAPTGIAHGAGGLT